MSTLSSNRIGAITEEIVIAELLKRDISVSRPVMDEPYDLVAEKNGKFLRIQCKTAYLRREGTIRINTSIRGQHYRGKIDYFATEYQGDVYLLHVDNCSKHKQDLRLCQKGSQSNSKMLEDYSIDKFTNIFKY